MAVSHAAGSTATSTYTIQKDISPLAMVIVWLQSPVRRTRMLETSLRGEELAWTLPSSEQGAFERRYRHIIPN